MIKNLRAEGKSPFPQPTQIVRLSLELSPQTLESADPDGPAIRVGGSGLPQAFAVVGGIADKALGFGSLGHTGPPRRGQQGLARNHFVHHQGVIQIKKNGFETHKEGTS